jgi:hypothetical protein
MLWALTEAPSTPTWMLAICCMRAGASGEQACANKGREEEGEGEDTGATASRQFAACSSIAAGKHASVTHIALAPRSRVQRQAKPTRQCVAWT